MAVFLPQPKIYSKSRKKRYKKSKKNKYRRISIPDADENNYIQSLNVHEIYRESQNGNLCKKHALVTVISCILTERKLQQVNNKLNDEKQKDEIKQNHRKQKKLKRKWKAQNFLSIKQYNKYCAQFDRNNGFDIGISAKYFFIGEKMTDNIFSYILTQFNIKSDYIAFDKNDGSIAQLLDIIKTRNVTKLIAFNFEHAWAYINVKNVWYEFDSLKKRSKPKPIRSFPYNCGYVYVYQ